MIGSGRNPCEIAKLEYIAQALGKDSIVALTYRRKCACVCVFWGGGVRVIILMGLY